MDTLLMAITAVSLGLAVVMSVVAWRVSRDERQRAAARVAALSAAAQVPAAVHPSIDSDEAPTPAQVAPWRSAAISAAAPSALDSFAGQTASLAATPATEAMPVPPAGTVSVQAGFLGTEAPARESGIHQRWLAAAAAVVAILLGGFVFVRMSGPAQPAIAAQQAGTSLELLSLRHEREGVNLSVAGLVRNPPSAPVVERVSAVVFLFDQQGQFITSAKAPIDFLKLTAGDESPFVVKVAAPQSVARYRVSFRTDDGTVPHVDRRGEPPVAAPVALVGK